MPRWITGVLLLALASPGWAQEPTPQTPGASPEAARAAALEAKLEAAWTEHVNAWKAEQLRLAEASRKAAEEAKAEGKPMPPMRAMGMVPPLGDFADRYLKAAMEFEGKPEALNFLKKRLQLGSRDAQVVTDTVERIFKAHMADERMGEVASMLARAGRLVGEDIVAGWSARILKETPHDTVKSQVLLAQAMPLLRSADPASAAYKEAKQTAQHALGLAGNPPALVAEIKGIIASRETLTDGGVAQDIAGIDLDGVAFKLSDYKGKVILLDFWGHW